MDIESLKTWIGRSRSAARKAETWPVHGLLATLDCEDRPEPGDAAPHLAQWLYFGPTVAQGRIATDGHPERGDFLPPVPLPRRMWAASDITFRRRIRLGEELSKTERIADVSLKEGSSGPLVFVKVANTYAGEAG
jgi:3-methylfumaryl-CoA hydratase